jgi:hypothetical protein
MEIVLLEIGVEVGLQATKSYIQHRQHMIDEHREDELISSRVKKYVREHYNNIHMSSSSTPPSSHSSPSTFSRLMRWSTPQPTRSGTPAAGELSPEFETFARKLLVFLQNEAICQRENPNSHLLKHKHYQQLLILSLLDQTTAAAPAAAASTNEEVDVNLSNTI